MARREEVVRLVFTEDEKAIVKAAADRDGLSMAAWVRATVLRAARKGEA